MRPDPGSHVLPDRVASPIAMRASVECPKPPHARPYTCARPPDEHFTAGDAVRGCQERRYRACLGRVAHAADRRRAAERIEGFLHADGLQRKLGPGRPRRQHVDESASHARVDGTGVSARVVSGRGRHSHIAIEKPRIREYSRQRHIPDRSWAPPRGRDGAARTRNLSIDPSRASKR